MKQFKKIVLFLLVIMMCVGSFSGAWAEEGEPSEGEEIPVFEPGPLMNEPEDHTLDIELDEDAEVRSGNLLSTALQRQLEEDIDRLLSFQPISSEEINTVITNVDDFLLSGGYSHNSGSIETSLQQDPALSAKASKIGLEATRDDLIEVIESGNNATGYIFVINRNSLAFRVEDENGEGIGHALVTITYKDPQGNSRVRSEYTTDGKLPGLCAFTEMKDVTYLSIDVQAEGYRAQTILDRKIMAGDIQYFQLKESPENDVYVRCADLAGKDLMFEDTNLTLVFSGSKPLEMRVIVTATGNRSLPSSITLKDRNSGRTISTFSTYSSVSPGGQVSRMFSSTQDWVKKDNLLKQDDFLSFDVEGEMHDIPYVIVRNALMQQGTSAEELPLTGGDTEVPLTDVMGGSGITNFTFKYFKIPVTVGVFPEGGFVVVATFDIESLSAKYSSLFEESWNPKTRTETESVLEPFKQEFWRKADRFKNGRGQMNDSKRVSFARDKYVSFNVCFSVYCSGVYNSKTGNFDGSFGGIFDAKLVGGVTQYFLVSTPIVIPFYLGFNVFGEFKAGISANFLWNKLSDGIGAAFKGAEHAMTQRYDLVAGLDLYAGVGLKGVCSLEAGGGGSFDFAAVTGTVEEPGKDATRFLIDSFAKIRVSGAIAFFSFDLFSKSFGPWRLYDTHPDKPLLGEPPEDEEIVFTEIDLAATSEDSTMLLAGNEDTGQLAHHKINTAPFTRTLVNDIQTITPLSVNSYGDNQVQIVSTRTTTALFRIASVDGKARVIYQKQDPATGAFVDDYFELPTLMRYDVTEFDVAASTNDRNWVYVGTVLANPEETDLDRRATTTRVQGVIVDLDEDKVITAKVMSPLPDVGKYYYHNPRVAGKDYDIAVAYQKSLSYRYLGDSDACVFGTNMKETVMGKGMIYTSGDIIDGEPSFFLRNREQSSSTFLIIDGYGADGYFDMDNPRYHYTLNVSGYQLGENENYITNWGYQNGTNYAIITGKMYYLEKYANSYDKYGYGMRLTEVENSEGLINRDNIYEFVMTDDNSGLCLVAVTTGVKVNMETGENEVSGSTIRIYTLEARYNESDKSNKAILHGPLDIYVDKIDVSTFAAVFNRETSSSKGLSIVYANIPEKTLTADGKIAWSDNLYQWQQNLKRGMVLKAVDFEDLFYYTDQHVLPIYISYQNIGYAIEGPIAFTIRDEYNNLIHEAWYNPVDQQYYDVGNDYVYNPGSTYTGDTRQMEITIFAPQYWEENRVHEVRIEVAPQYRGDAIPSLNSEVYDNKLTLKGRQIPLGDKHYANLTITNIGDEGMGLNKVAVEVRYMDEKKPYHTSYIDLSSVIGDPDLDHYDIRYDLTPYWDRAEQDEILSIRFYLVDEDLEPLTGESVFMYPRTINMSEDEPVEIIYEITEGADATWTKGSDSDHVIKVERNIEEETCFSHFTTVAIDGVELVRDTDYVAASGSTVITLKKEMMETLTDEEHNVVITFDDGVVETTLTIQAEEEEEPPVEPVDPVIPDNPPTGDTYDLNLWIGILGGSMAGLLLVAYLYFRKNKKQE